MPHDRQDGILMTLSAGFLPLLSFFLAMGLWLVQVELHDSWKITKDGILIVIFLPLLQVMLTVALAVRTASCSPILFHLDHVARRCAQQPHLQPRS